MVAAPLQMLLANKHCMNAGSLSFFVPVCNWHWPNAIITSAGQNTSPLLLELCTEEELPDEELPLPPSFTQRTEYKSVLAL
jgi:hypothetical protein